MRPQKVIITGNYKDKLKLPSNVNCMGDLQKKLETMPWSGTGI